MGHATEPGLLSVILTTLMPVAAAGVGGLIAAVRPPGAVWRSAIQHVAAGVVFAAAALELLPPVRRQPAGVALAGFGLGIALMVALRVFERKAERSTRAADRPG